MPRLFFWSPMLETDPIQLEHRRVILINYLKMKVQESDWHAVADAANDLRETELALAYTKQGGV